MVIILFRWAIVKGDIYPYCVLHMSYCTIVFGVSRKGAFCMYFVLFLQSYAARDNYLVRDNLNFRKDATCCGQLKLAIWL